MDINEYINDKWNGGFSGNIINLNGGWPSRDASCRPCPQSTKALCHAMALPHAFAQTGTKFGAKGTGPNRKPWRSKPFEGFVFEPLAIQPSNQVSA